MAKGLLFNENNLVDTTGLNIGTETIIVSEEHRYDYPVVPGKFSSDNVGNL